MTLILLSIHLVVCIALIGLVLLQRSEGGALGIGGSGGSLMSGRGAADALSKMTMFAGAFFMATSMGLTLITKFDSGDGRGVLDIVPSISAPATTTAPAATEAPTEAPATTPDPTQSSAPEAATSQLAAAEQPPATARTVSLGPAGAAASERAGPLTAATTPQRAPTTRPPPTTRQPTTTQPATTQPATVQRPATQQIATTGGPITTQRQPGPQPAPTTPALQLPGSAQAAAALQQPQGAVLSPESSEGEAGLAAVRRERAGPDQ